MIRRGHTIAGIRSALYQKAMSNKPIFFDESGRRAARIRVVAWAVGLSVLLILVGFVTSLALSPRVNGLDFPGRAAAVNPPSWRSAPRNPACLPAPSGWRGGPQAPAGGHRPPAPGAKRTAQPDAARHPQAAVRTAAGDRLLYQLGRSAMIRPGLRSNARSKYLDWVVPSWMELNGPDLISAPGSTSAPWTSSAPTSPASPSCP